MSLCSKSKFLEGQFSFEPRSCGRIIETLIIETQLTSCTTLYLVSGNLPILPFSTFFLSFQSNQLNLTNEEDSRVN